MKQNTDIQEHFYLDPFTKSVCIELAGKIKTLYQEDISLYELAQNFSSPPKEEWGHWSFPCFLLSQKIKKNPAAVAGEIAKACSNSPLFEKVSPEGAYANFFFQKSFLKDKLLDFLNKDNTSPLPKKKTNPYLIEYSQPNTHKELHIGHMRNICFGLALCTLLKKRAFPVISCTFPGDVGTHVAKCLWYLKYYNKEPFPLHRKGQWLGAIYTKACRQFDQAEETQKEKNKKQLTQILQELKNKKGDFYLLWQETRLWSKDLMKEVYKWAGVDFDHWYWESEVDKPSVEWINTLYKQGKLQLSESAIGMDLGESLGFCLLLKSDGNGLYATKDLYLAKKKFEDYKPSKNIYIVDQRQETHFQQVFKVLENIGFKEQAEKSLHLKYNFVELKTGAMSSRAGNIVPIMTLIETMNNYIIETFLKKYEGEWPEEKIKSTAHIIAQGAIKYGMNEQDLNKKIVFDREEWLKLDGRSGPYIQYAYARTCSLLKKISADFTEETVNTDVPLSPEEWSLITHLSWFSLTLEKSAWQMKTSPLCHYLFQLAQKFSRFYQSCPIGTLNNKEQKKFRLLLVQVVQKVLKEGLSCLGISAPQQM